MAQYPDNVCDVVYQGPTYTNWKGNQVPVRHKCQFSWYCDGKSDEPVDSKTYMETLFLADMILRGDVYDFTDGATHYHNDKVDPYWNDHLVLMLTIDNHIFYK
jgi:spore germination cell wall hydrolase CwlJ-like protein